MSYKICIKQFIPEDDKNITRVNQQRISKPRRNVKKVEEPVTQEDVIRSHISRLLKKRRIHEETGDKHNCSLQSINHPKSTQNTNRRKDGSSVSKDQQFPSNMLFKDYFSQSNQSVSKGSYFSTPRSSLPQKELACKYNGFKNRGLDRTTYFRKVLDPPQPLFKSEKVWNTERADQNKAFNEDLKLKDTQVGHIGQNSVSDEKLEMWGSTLSKLKLNMKRRARNKYNACQLKINRIETQIIGSTRLPHKYHRKQYSSKLSAILQDRHFNLQHKKPLKKNNLFEDLNPWSTHQIKLPQENQNFNDIDHS